MSSLILSMDRWFSSISNYSMGIYRFNSSNMYKYSSNAIL